MPVGVALVFRVGLRVQVTDGWGAGEFWNFPLGSQGVRFSFAAVFSWRELRATRVF